MYIKIKTISFLPVFFNFKKKYQLKKKTKVDFFILLNYQHSNNGDIINKIPYVTNCSKQPCVVPVCTFYLILFSNILLLINLEVVLSQCFAILLWIQGLASSRY